ncbi:MAG TPA: hypothetical protein VJM11_13590 [Nevskiaceae bacterium]|nr:hypothetical protein [Nevskiaceae bacterium]
MSAFFQVFVKLALPVVLFFLLGSALYGYLSPRPADDVNLLGVAVALYGTWYFWLRNTRKGVT